MSGVFDGAVFDALVFDCGDAVTVGGAGPASGGARRRRHYLIGDTECWLTDAELHDALAALVAKPEGPKRPPKRRQVASRARRTGTVPLAVSDQVAPDALAMVTFPAAPRFDRLWGKRWVQQQAAVANMLRQVAIEAQERADAEAFAEDEREIEMLLTEII